MSVFPKRKVVELELWKAGDASITMRSYEVHSAGVKVGSIDILENDLVILLTIPLPSAEVQHQYARKYKIKLLTETLFIVAAELEII